MTSPLPLPLSLSGVHDRLLTRIGHCILVLRQAIENSAATLRHPGT